VTVRDVVDQLGLKVRAGGGRLDREITGGYASDLLSDVMAHAREGDVWVTLQIHQNVVAVAVLTKAAAVITVGGREPAEDTVQSAEEKGIPLLTTELTAFEVVSRLHDAGVDRGQQSMR
jgi:predicted transcriptional regulator